MFYINYLWITIGAIMLLGSFAAINSRSNSLLDQCLSLVLMVAGAIALCAGLGVTQVDIVNDLLP